MVSRKDFFKSLSRRIKTYDFVGFDVETYYYRGRQEFYFGGLYYYDKNGDEVFKYFFDKEEMGRFMLSRKFKGCYIVATNLSFDFSAVFEGTRFFNDIKTIYNGSNLILATYDLGNNNGVIKMIDTFNYIGYSVEKLGSIIETPKLDSPKFMGLRKPKNSSELNYFITYNKRDCKISCDFMYFFQRGLNIKGGELKLTIASSSMDTFRRGYQVYAWEKEEDKLGDKSVKDLIRAGYYGGRCEVFIRGTLYNMNYYDINSLYPAMMLKDLPFPNSAFYPDTPDYNNIFSFRGISTVEVYVPEDINIPPLPYKSENGKLIFPVGHFEASYNHNELEFAIRKGVKVKEVKKQLCYSSGFKPFKRYITDLYNSRKEEKKNKSPMELVSKLLMNSLYGKFAQHKRENIEITDISQLSGEEKANTLLYGEGDIVGDKMITKTEEEFNGIFSFPIISSYITSYARMRLYEFLESCESVAYCDTDSIVTSSELPTSEELGDMKYEGSIAECEFIRPKFYRMDNDIKIKGINKATWQDFNKVKEGETIYKEKLSKPKESVRRGISSRSHIQVPKNLTLTDDKREWEQESNFSRPINIRGVGK